MLKGKMTVGLLGLFFAALIVAVAGLAQAAGGGGGGGGGFGGGGGGGGRFGGGGNFDPAQIRQMMMQRMKDALGATDEEWTIIEPRLQKVQDLSGDLRGGMRGMRGMFGGRGGRGGNAPQPAGTPTTPPTEVEKATTALQTTLEDPQAKPEVIKAQLAALRAAREKVRQQLDKATADLKEVLTVRQEAQLVLLGTFE